MQVTKFKLDRSRRRNILVKIFHRFFTDVFRKLQNVLNILKASVWDKNINMLLKFGDIYFFILIFDKNPPRVDRVRKSNYKLDWKKH